MIYNLCNLHVLRTLFSAFFWNLQMTSISWCYSGEYYLNLTLYQWNHKVSGDHEDSVDEGPALPREINYVKSVVCLPWNLLRLSMHVLSSLSICVLSMFILQLLLQQCGSLGSWSCRKVPYSSVKAHGGIIGGHWIRSLNWGVCGPVYWGRAVCPMKLNSMSTLQCKHNIITLQITSVRVLKYFY